MGHPTLTFPCTPSPPLHTLSSRALGAKEAGWVGGVCARAVSPVGVCCVRAHWWCVHFYCLPPFSFYFLVLFCERARVGGVKRACMCTCA